MDSENAQRRVGEINSQPTEKLVSLMADVLQTDQKLFESHDCNMNILRAPDIAAEDLNACFELIRETSSAAYKAASTHTWNPKAKLAEMKDPDMWYLLVRSEEHDSPSGFASFMITVEDDYPVAYLYEIHLTTALRRKRIGDALMNAVEGIGQIFGMEKVMLTVFTSNKGAERFYERQGYGIDEYSPQPRVLRGGKIKRPEYVILSKALKSSV